MSRRLTLAALFAALAGCSDGRLALELLVAPPCGTATRVHLDFATTPASVSSRPAGVDVAFDLPGQSNRVLLVLPAGTTRVDTTATGYDDGGLTVATGALGVDLAAGLTHATLTLDEACGAVDGGGGDLPAGPAITAVATRGFWEDALYEGEGSTGSPASGVAILVTGSNLAGQAVTIDPGATLGPVVVSADGTRLVTSAAVAVDPALPAGQTTVLQLHVGTATAALTIKGLDELVTSGVVSVAGARARYSRIQLSQATLSSTAPVPLFIDVAGDVVGSGVISASSVNGGYPGCTSGCNASQNGPGFGGGSASTSDSGAGAGYSVPGNNGQNTLGGATYGDPSLIGLSGGSGGGGAGAIAGGSGGGVLRLRAGAIDAASIQVRALGGPGLNGGVQGGSGGGSGGAILAQGRDGLVLFDAVFSGGNAVGGTPSGGSGGKGRLRLDVGIPVSFTSSLPAQYVGATLRSSTATAWGLPPASVTVVCGTGTPYQLVVDTVVEKSQHTCAATGLAGVEETVTVPAELRTLLGPGLHWLCVRVLPVTGSPSLRYTTDLDREDQSCRPIAIADGP